MFRTKIIIMNIPLHNKKRHIQMKKIFNYTIITTFIMLVLSCHHKTEEPAPDKFVLSDTMAKMIQVGTVGNCDIDNALTLSGQVSFDENNVNKIYPNSSGQVIESRVSLGDKVTKGEVLAVVRSADIAGNYADLSSSESDITIAKKELDNEQSLYQSGIASEKEYLEAKEDYQKALSAKQKITSSINLNSGVQTSANGTYKLVSPISGYIVEKKINAGDFIRADAGDNLFTVSDLKDVWVWANVFEEDISKIAVGADAQVTTLAFPDKVYNGKVDNISQVLDPDNKAMKVRIKLSNSDLTLKPDMFAKVVVNAKQSNQALCIPFSSVLTEDGKNYIVCYYSKDSLKVKQVDLLQVSGAKAYINGDLNVGDKVVTKNQLLLYNALNAEF